MSDYISVILGGLYAITLISITIFSIVNNIVQQKTMGLSPISLKRYNIMMIFSPIYILTICVGLIIYIPDNYNNLSFVFWISVFLIMLITIHAYSILEPFYNLEKFKVTLIKNRIKKLKKENKKNSNTILEKNIIIELKKLDEYNRKNSYFSIEDVQSIWNGYLRIITDKDINTSNDFKKELVQIGFVVFGNDFIFISESETMVREELIEMIIKNKLNNNNVILFEFVFNKLYELYDYYKKNNEGFEKFNQLFKDYLYQIFLTPKYINLLFELILDEKWNIKDAEYISLYLKKIINMDKFIDYSVVVSNEKLDEIINYLLVCYNDESEFKCKYGEDFDEFIKSCFILIRKDMRND